MITKEIALGLRHGQILHSKEVKNRDGSPMRVRVNGKVKTWKTRPSDFKIPVKHGLSVYGYVDNCDVCNAMNWEIGDGK